MKQKMPGVGVGTISLIMIFSVLCLTVFAMLTLSTSNAEKILADKTSSFVSGYYNADSQATKIRAQILASYETGVYPPSVEGVDIAYSREDGTTVASYACVVNDVQNLMVELRLENDKAVIMQWKTGYAEDWESDDAMPVWDMDDFLGSVLGE